MTTAHRPTWQPAKGGEEQGGARYFAPSAMTRAKDLASHTQLKYRQDGQATDAELASRDLKLELQEKELEAARKRASAGSGPVDESRALLLAPPGRLVPSAIDADDSDESAGEGDGDEGACVAQDCGL